MPVCGPATPRRQRLASLPSPVRGQGGIATRVLTRLGRPVSVPTERRRSCRHRSGLGSTQDLDCSTVAFDGAHGDIAGWRGSDPDGRWVMPCRARGRGRCRTHQTARAAASLLGERPASLPGPGETAAGRSLGTERTEPRPQDQLASLTTRPDGCADAASQADMPKRVSGTARLARARQRGQYSTVR